MDYEHDPDKSASNKLKHGIDFEEAKSLFDDTRRLELDAQSQSEARYVAVGRLGGRHWAAIFTRRGAASGSSRCDWHEPARYGSMKAHDIDLVFDEGGSLDGIVDWSKGRRINQPATTVSIELSPRLIDAVDGEAERRGLSREDVIRALISDHLA
ncbi:BrnT family toxin [Jiella sonneratiae]|nr:BrnT family toxin [Jiella sonneratiae]